MLWDDIVMSIPSASFRACSEMWAERVVSGSWFQKYT